MAQGKAATVVKFGRFAATEGLRRALRGAQRFGGVVGTSKDARRAELLALGSKIGVESAAHRAKRVFASAERREALDEAHMLRTAAQVTEALGGMKGVLMKLGQMQSYLNDDLPPAWRDALAALQADSPPMAPELAASVVENSLGSAPEKLFAQWDPVPLAAASVGQVHRAITLDGRAAAVKVQYPGAADALTADLDNIEGFLQLVLAASNDADAPSMQDLEPLVIEIRARIIEEIDYRNEAANQRRFASYFDGHPFIHIPPVIDELSAGDVLTTELADGVRFAEAMTWTEEERAAAAETVFRFVQHSVFRLGAYNGDPHPGNYLFLPGGRVTFLDFGLVKTVDAPTTELLTACFEHGMLGDDPAGFRTAMEAAGFIKPNADVSDDVVYRLIAEPWQKMFAAEVAPMPFPRSDMKRGNEQTDEERALARAFDLPATFVILMRTFAGMQALVARLGAERAWRGIAEQIWPSRNGPATTPLGATEAAWLAMRS